MQSSSQIITTNKLTYSFLQAGCPSCCPTNSVKELNEKISHFIDLLTPGSPGVFQLCLWPLTAPGYLGGGLPCLSSALWCIKINYLAALGFSKAWYHSWFMMMNEVAVTQQSLVAGKLLQFHLKVHSATPRRVIGVGAHLPVFGRWARRWINQCDAWPVRRQTYSYFPSLRRYQIYTAWRSTVGCPGC